MITFSKLEALLFTNSMNFKITLKVLLIVKTTNKLQMESLVYDFETFSYNPRRITQKEASPAGELKN